MFLGHVFRMFFQLVTLLGWLHPILAQAVEQPAPPGFSLLFSSETENSAPGIQLYQKNYPNGSPDFVQVINLRQGAALVPMYGAIAKPGSGQGVFGGDNPTFRKQSLPQFWQQLRSQQENAVCVLNGQFFFMADDPTHLPFPLKDQGVIISDGYDDQNFIGQTQMLEIWPDHVRISPLTQAALYTSSAPAIIGGLSEDANKRIKQYTGRTCVGVRDLDGNEQAEILLIFNTLSARQVDAAGVLRDFGAQAVMMLDGGGSTQLMCNGKWLVRSDRLIPQAIGVVAGGYPMAAASTVAQANPSPEEPATVEPAPVEPASVGQASAESAPADLSPSTNDESILVASAVSSASVLPLEIDQAAALSQQIKAETLALTQSAIVKIDYQSVLLIPAVMLPAGFLFMLWATRARRRVRWDDL